MKIYRIDSDRPRWARLEKDGALAGYDPSHSLSDVLAREVSPIDEVSLDDASLLAPVERPGKIVCVGVNYLDHCLETGTEPPKQPLLFAKFPSVITGPGSTVAWDASSTSQVDYEAELVVMIGTTADHTPLENALDHVAGYMCGNDLSARDLQLGDGQWTRGKNLQGFCALGPCLVTADEVPEPQALAIECRVNGVVMQSSSTEKMIFGVAEIISFCSHHFVLEPGDIIMTGTPHGVALGRSPSPWLADNDIVDVTIDQVGSLTNTCRER